MYYWEDPLFDWSCSGHTEGDYEYLFGKTQCLNKSRLDESLLEPGQHEIDPPYNAVVTMLVNHPEFMLWCEREMFLLGIDDLEKAGFKGLADAVLRCIPTAKLLREMDMYSNYIKEN